MKHCDDQADCDRAVYYAASYNGVDADGNPYGSFSFVKPSTLEPKAKYNRTKDYVRGHEPPLP